MLPYIDMHCDTLGVCLRGESDIFELEDTMLDVKRMMRAGQAAQFFAVFFRPEGERLPNGAPIPADDEFFQLHRSLLLGSIAAHGEIQGQLGQVGLTGIRVDGPGRVGEGVVQGVVGAAEGLAVGTGVDIGEISCHRRYLRRTDAPAGR